MKAIVFCTVVVSGAILSPASVTQARDDGLSPSHLMSIERGQVARQWLDQQRQGDKAAASPQSLPGSVMEQIYDRYQKSFSHPVPEHFPRGGIKTGDSQ